ncbi:hypothetical protein ACVWXN_006955 [Bradyrhizobium sp. i1.4.4]
MAYLLLASPRRLSSVGRVKDTLLSGRSGAIKTVITEAVRWQRQLVGFG